MTNQAVTLTLNAPTLDAMLSQLRDSAKSMEHILGILCVLLFIGLGFQVLNILLTLKRQNESKRTSSETIGTN